MWKIIVQLNGIYQEGQIGREFPLWQTLWKIYLDYLLLVPAAHIDEISCGPRGSPDTGSSMMRDRLKEHLRQRYSGTNGLAQNRDLMDTHNATESGSTAATVQEIANSRGARPLTTLAKRISSFARFLCCLCRHSCDNMAGRECTSMA
ncbi:hypothetical protein BDZ91DRAFT_336302 [Kalaharituber pfeilii]|nr:hypothetical protein BDZ91DRAFT_336302 [Kalaharituber pfeilii]